MYFIAAVHVAEIFMIENIIICTVHMLVGDIRLRMMNWAGHVSHMEKMRNPSHLALVFVFVVVSRMC